MSEELYRWLAEYGFPRDTLADLREYMESEAEREDTAMNADIEKERDKADSVEGDYLRAVLDQRMMMDRDKRKWYLLAQEFSRRGGRRKTKKRGICFHHSAVIGGFGTHRHTREGIENGTVAIPKLLEWPDSVDEATATRAFALAARYRGVAADGIPYHAISCANSVLVLNLPFNLVSWHGHGSNNDFIGHCWDANSAHESLKAEDLIWDVEYLVDLGRTEGHFIDDLEFTTHSAYSNKPRDPGAEFIRYVMQVAAHRTGARIDLDAKHGNGEPIRTVIS